MSPKSFVQALSSTWKVIFPYMHKYKHYLLFKTQQIFPCPANKSQTLLAQSCCHRSCILPGNIVTSQWDDEQLKSMDCVLLISVSPYSSGSRSSVMLGWDLQGHMNFIYMISSISQFPMEAALGCLKWESQICCCCFNGERWRKRWAGAFKLLSIMPSEPSEETEVLKCGRRSREGVAKAA